MCSLTLRHLLAGVRTHLVWGRDRELRSAGELLTASLTDYVFPTAIEAPAISTVHLDAESPSTVGYFRGMGEGGTIGAPAAIANALADALAPLGAEIFEPPMTPERLVSADR